MTSHTTASHTPSVPDVTLRDPADLADALPYLMGFRPDDSVVLMALHRPNGRFGARLHVGIPQDPAQWKPTAELLAHHLVHGSERRGGKPDGILVFLCRDPAPGEERRAVMERLRPLAQAVRLACGALDVPVWEALCVSGDRWWSYVCAQACCDGSGTPVGTPGTSVMAAAAAYAGIQIRGSLSELESRFAPLEGDHATKQIQALCEASRQVLPRMVDRACVEEVREETAVLLSAAVDRFREAPPGKGADAERDRADDALLDAHEAATIILGLQDRIARDRAAEWMEVPDAGPALRLWRALARRCVGPFLEHAAAPVTLAGWVAWSSGDQAEARVAFQRALAIDPEYTFAHLLYEACTTGLDPEPLRRCLREERGVRNSLSD